MEAPRREGAVYGEEIHEPRGARLRREAALVMTPTLYEWAGGGRGARPPHAGLLPAASHDDPILSLVFARDVPPEHPHHVALWLGEVFGGPPVYTEEHGGYPHMLAQAPRARADRRSSAPAGSR